MAERADEVSQGTPSKPARPPPSGSASALAFLAAAVLAVACAMPGGSYDLVIRQEAGLVIWWVLALGFAFGLLPRVRPRALVGAPLAALLLLGLWTLLSLAWTESDERTLGEVTRVAGYLGLLVLVVSTLDRNTWRSAVAGLAAGSLVVAGLAAGSRLAPELFPRDPVRALSPGRLNYPFNYWNAVGAWGAMAVTAGLAWSVAARRPLFRALFLAAVPIAALSIYLSYSRASIAGIAAGLICLLALSRHRLLMLVHLLAAGAASGLAILAVRGEPAVARGEAGGDASGTLAALAAGAVLCALVAGLTWVARADRRWRMPTRAGRVAVVAGLATVLLAGALAGPGAASRAWDSFKDQGGTASQEARQATTNDPARRLGDLHGSRYEVWSSALDGYRANAGLGTGAGTFEFTWNRDGRSPEFVRDAHSIYLEPLSELGFPGAALTLAFLVAALVVSALVLRRATRSRTHAAAVAAIAVFVVFLVQAGVDWMWESTAVTVLALGGVGAMWARHSATGGPPRIPALARAAMCVASLVACLLFVPGLASTSLVRKSQESVRAGNLGQARQRADDAVAAAPWAMTPRLQRGLVSEAGGELRSAQIDIADAASREPENWRPVLLLARVQAERGLPGPALVSIRRARKLRPRALALQRLVPQP